MYIQQPKHLYISYVNIKYIHMIREFDAQLRKVGNSYVITVPSSIIKRFKLKPKHFITISLNVNENEKN